MRRYRLSGRPLPTELRRAWSSGGGGELDHACHQRERKIQGVSHPRTRRTAIGQVVTSGGAITRFSRVPRIFPPPPRRGLVGRGGGNPRTRNVRAWPPCSGWLG